MPENWITLADADVLEPLAQERVSIAAIKKRDDLGDICDQVTQQVRQAYVFGSRDVGPEGTIPEGLKARAVSIALWRFISEGVPKNEGVQTKQREASYREALEFLDKISAVEVGLATSPSIAKKCRRFRHDQEDGI